jgi:glycosyltransferase involved in cell wall biosynthesis
MTVFTITYNEELMLPYFVNHYRSRFTNCKIVVYDNESTDKTVEIAERLGCKVLTYKTDNRLNDLVYLEIKNNCWKNELDWVIIADCDELVDINEDNLINEKASIIRVEAYNMVNLRNDLNIEGITNGVRAESYDKSYCFNASKIDEIGYGAGCHWCDPKGLVEYSENIYKAYHYKYINIDYMINRHAIFASRLSDENIRRGYGTHYMYGEEQITNEFLEARKNSIKIL